MSAAVVCADDVVALTLHPAFNAGYECGLAHGRAQLEPLLLTQEQLLDEVEARWRAWVLFEANAEKVARALRASPSYLELVQRRYLPGEGPAGAPAVQRLLAAAAQHQRVWAGWPRAGAA